MFVNYYSSYSVHYTYTCDHPKIFHQNPENLCDFKFMIEWVCCSLGVDVIPVNHHDAWRQTEADDTSILREATSDAWQCLVNITWMIPELDNESQRYNVKEMTLHASPYFCSSIKNINVTSAQFMVIWQRVSCIMIYSSHMCQSLFNVLYQSWVPVLF